MKEQSSPYGKLFIGSSSELFAKAIEIANETAANATREEISWALHGGSTPLEFYKHIRENQSLSPEFLQKARWFTSDERFVPVSSDDSNFGNLDRNLLSHYDVEEDHKFPWPTDQQPEQAAHMYGDLLENLQGPHGCFDLCFLGMGDDGHTASLFPNSPILAQNPTTYFESVEVPGKGHRLTITPHGLKDCGRIVVMVCGENKAITLSAVLNGLAQPSVYPIQTLAHVAPKTTWLIDEPAAAKL